MGGHLARTVAASPQELVPDDTGASGRNVKNENGKPAYLADSKVMCVKRLYGDNFVVDESVFDGKAVGRPFGLEGKGRTVRARLLHIIEFANDGKIQRENAWIDMAALMQQLPPGE